MLSLKLAPRTTQVDRLVDRLNVQPGVQELRALRTDLDVVAPESAALAESAGRKFFGRPSSSDLLRLPQRTHLDGPNMRASVRRVLEVDTQKVGAERDVVIKEERMRRVLSALDAAVHHIHRRATRV
ncbi:MAG: hypothetical protein HYV07_27830 [Deltaproteobacteria bacterium]|nr:hypothetical protein [Deltaproteobacteria bacterium]